MGLRPILIGLLWLSALGCQTTPELTKQDVTKLVQKSVTEKVVQEQEELKAELYEDLQRMIRNEIVPEIREVTTHSITLRRRQRKAKGEALEKTVIGRVEWIQTKSPEVRFRARVDTGAQTNSIHAVDIKEIERDGKMYVQFTTEDDEGKKHTYLKPVVKRTRVRSTSGQVESRYVVKMDFLFGGREYMANVNLNNRSKMRHKFLIGRNLLLGNFIVDVSQSRLAEE